MKANTSANVTFQRIVSASHRNGLSDQFCLFVSHTYRVSTFSPLLSFLKIQSWGAYLFSWNLFANREVFIHTVRLYSQCVSSQQCGCSYRLAVLNLDDFRSTSYNNYSCTFSSVSLNQTSQQPETLFAALAFASFMSSISNKYNFPVRWLGGLFSLNLLRNWFSPNSILSVSVVLMQMKQRHFRSRVSAIHQHSEGLAESRLFSNTNVPRIDWVRASSS